MPKESSRTELLAAFRALRTPRALPDGNPQVENLTQVVSFSRIVRFRNVPGSLPRPFLLVGPVCGNPMRFSIPHRMTALRAIAVLSFLSGMCLSGGEVVRASCGDYLLMDHDAHPAGRDGHMGEWHFLSGETALSMRADGQGEPSAPAPSSPCASGRCHSAPLIPPPQDHSRGFVWKGEAIVVGSGAKEADRDASGWGLPTDGNAALKPFLAVDVPPPRVVFLAF